MTAESVHEPYSLREILQAIATYDRYYILSASVGASDLFIFFFISGQIQEYLTYTS